MKTEQVNLRLEVDLIAALEAAAREEALDRGTMIRKLLIRGLSRRRLDRAMEEYQAGEISMGRAAEDAGVTLYDIMDEARRRGIEYQLDLAEVEEMLADLPRVVRQLSRVAEAPPAHRARGGAARARPRAARGSAETLPDRVPRPGGVLLVGINPAPPSVLAGHYYQGKLGRRLWKRLAGIGLLAGAVPGSEDDAFAGTGHGLTDVVKRPTRSASALTREEIRRGVEELREKVRSWRPGLILFAFKQAARAVTGVDFPPGEGPRIEGVPTFLLSGPYAPRSATVRVNRELGRVLGIRGEGSGGRVRSD